MPRPVDAVRALRSLAAGAIRARGIRGAEDHADDVVDGAASIARQNADLVAGLDELVRERLERRVQLCEQWRVIAFGVGEPAKRELVRGYSDVSGQAIERDLTFELGCIECVQRLLCLFDRGLEETDVAARDEVAERLQAVDSHAEHRALAQQCFDDLLGAVLHDRPFVDLCAHRSTVGSVRRWRTSPVGRGGQCVNHETNNSRRRDGDCVTSCRSSIDR
jgi:hypothetical protein